MIYRRGGHGGLEPGREAGRWLTGPSWPPCPARLDASAFHEAAF